MFNISCWLHGTNPPRKNVRSDNLLSALFTTFSELKRQGVSQDEVLYNTMSFIAYVSINGVEVHYHGTMRATNADINNPYAITMPTIEWHENGVVYK